MCARRFLLLVFVATLLAVAGAVAIFQFGQDVLIRSATPKGEFRAPAASEGPDYSRPQSWLARPGGPRIAWIPPVPAPEAPEAATFYVHPTTYLERDRWNAPLAGNRDSDGRARLFVETQASAFAGASEVWAPRYRQAAYGAFLLRSDDAVSALELAYGDVARAFDAFLAANPGKPLILAGHSQGALHVLRLLADRRPELNSRLVAAYVVGWPVSRTADLPATGLAACATADDTGCVMSWQSFAQPANPALILDAWEKTDGRDGPHRRRDMICTNPLTGTLNGSAQPAANPGTLVPAPDMQSARLEAGLVGARCHKNLLVIDGPAPALGPFVLPGNNYHVYDFALFWGGVRRDVERRVKAWR